MVSSNPSAASRRLPSVLTWVSIGAAVVLPVLGFLAWQHSPLMSGIVATLQVVEVDPLRGSIIGAVVGVLLVTLVVALLTRRPFICWLLGGAAYAILFAIELPDQRGPQLLPHQTIDHQKLLIALAGVIAMGVAGAGVGSGIGRALRVGAEALWRLRRGFAPQRLLLLIPLVLLGAVTVYGLGVTHGVLVNGPWAGVVQGTAVPTNSATSPARQVTFSYYSKAFGTTRQAIVMLPAGYDSSPTKRYPTVYLLHGSPGAVGDWPNVLGAAQIEASAEQSGAPPLILVAANGVGPKGGSNDSWANGYVPGDNMASDLIDSLIPAIDDHFRTLTGRTHRAIGGLSTGGYGAANLALQYPNLFGLSIVLSVDPLQPPSGSFGGNVAEQKANNPLLLAQTPADAKSPIFYVGWGVSDTAAAPNSQQLVSALHASGYTVTTDPVPGGHDDGVWEKTLYDALVADGKKLE